MCAEGEVLCIACVKLFSSWFDLEVCNQWALILIYFIHNSAKCPSRKAPSSSKKSATWSSAKGSCRKNNFDLQTRMFEFLDAK